MLVCFITLKFTFRCRVGRVAFAHSLLAFPWCLPCVKLHQILSKQMHKTWKISPHKLPCCQVPFLLGVLLNWKCKSLNKCKFAKGTENHIFEILIHFAARFLFNKSNCRNVELDIAFFVKLSKKCAPKKLGSHLFALFCSHFLFS